MPRTSANHHPDALAQWLLSTLDDQALVVLDKRLKIVYVSQPATDLLHVDDFELGEALLPQLKQAWRGKYKLGVAWAELEGWLQSGADNQLPLTVSMRSAAEPTWLTWKLYHSPRSGPLKDLKVLMVRDVSQQRQMEDQLNHQLAEIADQNKQWQLIYNGVQESIVLLNTKGRILTLNPATEKITSHKAHEVIGKHIGELFPKVGALGSGIDYKGRSGLYQTLAEQRPSDLFEAVVETKDKRHIWINYTYNPIWDSNGKMVALVRVTSDVSQVKAVEQMKNDFVSIASHELRTPLGVINGYLNLFLSGQLGELTPDQHTFLERLYHSSTDMVVLVEDLLNVSRIEAGRLEVNVMPFDVVDLVTEIIDHLAPRYQAKDLKLRLVKPKTPVIARADAQKVGQALTNLIDNAIKYTYDNGAITISIKPKPHSVEVSIKDSGVGIKPGNLGHVFEKFYRESNPLSVKEGGSGLGLYISRKLIELHGGTITVKSRLGEGSQFTVTIPLNNASS